MNREITEVPGVPETALPAGLDVPAGVPPAPWECRCDAVVWVARTGAAAARAVPAAVAALGRPVAVLGGFVHYHDTPVGGYDEVLGAVVVATRRGPVATAPFMAVDSAASVGGGRMNWSLPKTLAEFTGSPGGSVLAEGEGWSVGATARAPRHGPRIASTARLVQCFPDGAVRSARLRAGGHASPALVSVGVTSHGTLPRWLRPGSHPGAVLRDARFTLGAPGRALGADVRKPGRSSRGNEEHDLC